jgi:hypothetical protein
LKPFHDNLEYPAYLARFHHLAHRRAEANEKGLSHAPFPYDLCPCFCSLFGRCVCVCSNGGTGTSRNVRRSVCPG